MVNIVKELLWRSEPKEVVEEPKEVVEEPKEVVEEPKEVVEKPKRYPRMYQLKYEEE